MKKFTTKTEKASGSYSSFYNDYIKIKLGKQFCGRIRFSSDSGNRPPLKIGLQVYKDESYDKKDPCEWKWIYLKKEFQDRRELLSWMNENQESILSKFKLYLSDDD